MKIKKYKHIKNKSKSFRLFFSPSWTPHKQHHFTIHTGKASLELGGKEARMLYTFLSKVY